MWVKDQHVMPANIFSGTGTKQSKKPPGLKGGILTRPKVGVAIAIVADKRTITDPRLVL